MENYDVNEILLKAPFRRILPNPVVWTGMQTSDTAKVQVPQSMALYRTINQDVFLREYYPTGHQILNPAYYPDRLKTDESGKTYIHYVQRYASCWNDTITIKHLTHLCGKPIVFTNANPEMMESQDSIMTTLKQGWIKKNMEVAWYEAAKSVKITGDSAICFYLNNGKLGWRVFSYLNDEILYPHYDSITGRLKLFARKYKQYDEEGLSVTDEFVDVYDNSMVTTYRRDLSGGSIIKFAKKIFGMSGWTVVGRQPHGFDRIPVAYKRNDGGPCWSNVQASIDDFEIAVSQLLENNQSYAFRMLFLKGDNVDIQYDALGQPTAVVGDKDSDAKFLDKADASETFKLALDILEKNILTGSFTVLPPDVSSGGNLPSVTVKILYSPAVEKGMSDAKEYNQFIDDVVDLFKYGYGIELGRTHEFTNLDVQGSIDVYIPQNDAEIIQNLNASVTSKTISRETGNELHPYSASNEKDRMKKQDEVDAKNEEDLAARKVADAAGNANNSGVNDFNKKEELNAALAK